MVQLGGLVSGYPWEVPLRLKLVSLFYSLKVSIKLKIKNTWLILLSRIIIHFTQMHYAVAKCQSLLLRQIISFCTGCDQNGDRMSKNFESCHFCIR